jgi:signal transduction histidine kinase
MSVTKKNGEEFPVDISLTSYVTNHLKFYTAFVVDLTEHVAAEKKQRELVKEAKTANSAKSEFLANMSHELRTPLNSIIGFAEMMEHEVRGPLPDDYREYSQLISGSGQLLLATVNSILDIAKIEAGKFDLHKEATDMVPIVGEITTLLSVQSNNKNIDLINDTHDLPCLYVDPLRARQIMMNIIGNAIKFTDEGRVRVTNRNFKNGYDITISDSGIGMTPDEVKIALKPFEQVYGTSLARRYQGTGLGLSLSRQIMELHGGKLIVESKPNKGTAVTLRFPLEAGVACAE